MDRVALITGGARGIGRRIVLDFAKQGYKVAFSYNTSKDRAMQVCNDLTHMGVDFYCAKMNLAKDREIDDFVRAVVDKFGKIDVLINNSATTNDSLFRDKTTQGFENVLRVNLVGSFYISKIVGDIMYKNKSGKIINISSTNGISTYYPMCVEYDASKAGVNSLTHNLAVQYAPYVNVNAIAPGFVATESEIKDMDDEFVKQEEEKILLRRAGTEEDVSNLVMFLASEKADYINNQVIKINGGVYGD